MRQDAVIRAQMCEIGRRLWQRGLVGATEGNLSVRLSARQILCTPSGVSKGHLEPDQLVVVDPKGNALEGGPPSSEIRLHLRIYARRPDCHAVVHAHPPTATGFALAGEEIPDDMLAESAYVLGSVPVAPFGFPGTEEVADSIEPLLADHKALLLANHGAVTLGRTLEDAYLRMETLERVAKIVLVAKLLGGGKPMPPDALTRLAPLLNGDL